MTEQEKNIAILVKDAMNRAACQEVGKHDLSRDDPFPFIGVAAMDILAESMVSAMGVAEGHPDRHYFFGHFVNKLSTFATDLILASESREQP